MPTDDLTAAAHVVQQALTPVFLLSGIASLLGVFASRLGRVADQADALTQKPGTSAHSRQRTSLKWRSRALDVAVVLAALAVAFTCAAVLVLFLGGVRHAARSEALFLAFGGAVMLTMGSVLAFVVEMLLAARGVRIDVDSHAQRQPSGPDQQAR